MTENQTITVLDNLQEICDGDFNSGEIIDFELDIAGKKIPFHINVMAKNATLADIVPLARKISTKLAIAFVADIREKGHIVPCSKGCCACCSSLIPLSVPEAFRLREELLAIPGNVSNQIMRSCINTAEKILDKAQCTAQIEGFLKNRKPRISQINKWYGELKLACPLLSENLCTLYEQRPLACREHIVTGSSASCQIKSKCRPNVAIMPVSVLETLGQLASELEQTEVEAVMLPLSFAWAQDNIERAKRTWPTAEMVKRFVEILKQKLSKKKNVPATLPA
ncbi:MAG: YkgJ family cysteine cluster protein [Phycisphaerae bacterium]|nr:YkgJ family cysteine cluster protein [Phycisphaerae bacterium]